MGFVANVLGLGGGGGANFQAQSAQIQQPTSSGMANQAYGTSQEGLNLQRAFLMALQGQNGIGNQSKVFQQQQALADQLQGVANGTGPNPAAAALAQATSNNVANQAALMAGARGASRNAGLIARQAAQQGAGIQQQAAGQAATMQAQQQLSGMEALQNQQANMANLSGQQVQNQANTLNAYNQAAQNEQQNLLNSIAQQNNASVAMQSNMNQTNAEMAKGAQSGHQGLVGGILNGITSAIGLADGGVVPSAPSLPQPGPRSAFGQFLQGFQNAPAPQPGAPVPGAPNIQVFTPAQGYNQVGNTVGGGLVRGVSSLFGGHPGMAKGGAVSSLKSKGGSVPGKAKVKGDSFKNDTVKTKLSPKEIVLPRSITMAPDAPEKAKQFVAQILARQGLRK